MIFSVSRYTPEVGDLIVGRITEVQSRRWRVDVSSKQDAILMLASVNLPGGVQVGQRDPSVVGFNRIIAQRRKLESDELQMRTYFEEGDLLVAEVQQVMGDGSCWLHTRSLRYGKVSKNVHAGIMVSHKVISYETGPSSRSTQYLFGD
jgi:exosome complex component RRP4